MARGSVESDNDAQRDVRCEQQVPVGCKCYARFCTSCVCLETSALSLLHLQLARSANTARSVPVERITGQSDGTHTYSQSVSLVFFVLRTRNSRANF